MVTGTLRDPEFVKLTLKTVPIIASREFHGIKKEEIGGVVKGVCAKFGAAPCEAHQNLETPARVDLCGTDVQTPQVVVCLPDKSVVKRIVDVAPISGYQEIIAAGAKKLGKGLTAAELKQIRDQVRDANAKIDKGDWAAALKVVKEVATVAAGTPFTKESDALSARIAAEAKKALERALAAEKSGDTLTALRTLEDAADDFAGTDAVAVLKKELTRIRSSKAGSEAGRVLAKERKALQSFEAGQAAEKGKDFVAARREYQRVLAGASGTPLADRAKARLDALSADPDIKAIFDRADRDVKAAAALKDAEKLIGLGEKAKAADALKRIVEDYPGTAAAATAKTKLEELR
jgi:hypothetical protein